MNTPNAYNLGKKAGIVVLSFLTVLGISSGFKSNPSDTQIATADTPDATFQKDFQAAKAQSEELNSVTTDPNNDSDENLAVRKIDGWIYKGDFDNDSFNDSVVFRSDGTFVAINSVFSETEWLSFFNSGQNEDRLFARLDSDDEFRIAFFARLDNDRNFEREFSRHFRDDDNFRHKFTDRLDRDDRFRKEFADSSRERGIVTVDFSQKFVSDSNFRKDTLDKLNSDSQARQDFTNKIDKVVSAVSSVPAPVVAPVVPSLNQGSQNVSDQKQGGIISGGKDSLKQNSNVGGSSNNSISDKANQVQSNNGVSRVASPVVPPVAPDVKQPVVPDVKPVVPKYIPQQPQNQPPVSLPLVNNQSQHSQQNFNDQGSRAQSFSAPTPPSNFVPKIERVAPVAPPISSQYLPKDFSMPSSGYSAGQSNSFSSSSSSSSSTSSSTHHGK